MTGVMFATLSAFIWGLNGIIVRLGVRDVDPQAAAFVSVVPALAIMGLTSLAFEDLSALSSPPWLAMGVFACSGIVTFTLARTLYFLSVRQIGPSRTGIFLAARVIIAPLLGVVILSEPFTPRIAAGGVMMFLGFTLLIHER